MRAASRALAVARFLRNLPTALSVFKRYLDLDPAYAASISLRALPKAVRQLLVATARHRASARAAIVIAADGDTGNALETLQRAAESASCHKLRRLIAAAAALDAPRTARDLLDRLPGGDPAQPYLSALVQAREGNLSKAIAAVPEGVRGRRIHRRLVSELQTITTHVATGHSAEPRAEHVPGRVLHLVTNSLPETTAGYTIRTQRIAAAQRADGVDAHVATRLGFPVTSGNVAASLTAEVDGVPYYRSIPRFGLPSGSDQLLAADVDATSRLVESLRPAVLHAHSKHTNAQVALAVRERHGVPVVYEVRGFLEETWRSRGRSPNTDIYRRSRELETRCMLAADAVVTISESMRDEIVGRGVPANKVDVVPNATDESFLAELPSPDGLRQSIDVGPDEIVVGALSTLNAYEGIDVLIEAVAQLTEARFPVRLMVVGDGPARSQLIDLAGSHGLRHRAIFPGRVPYKDVRKYHSAIDVFCVPRLDTPVTRLVPPLKPIEAMAAGRPVIASDLPPLREIVQHARTGLLVKPNHSFELANAIEALLRDVALRKQLGRQARSWVAANRTWSVLQPVYRDLYSRLGAFDEIPAVSLL